MSTNAAALLSKVKETVDTAVSAINPTTYKMYINYDNDSKVYVIPVLPEKLELSVKGQTTSIKIDQFGEVLHRGMRDARVISFSSYFPAKYSRSYCSCKESEFKKPVKYDNWMITLERMEKPCHFVLTGGPMATNLYMDITSYKSYEQGGDVGTIYYTLEMKRHRKPKTSTYKKKSSSSSKKTSKAKKTTTGNRTNNKSTPKSYTVKSGDCLSLIAQKLKKQYGISTSSSALYQKNKTAIEKAAKKYGHSSSNNGWWIFPGTKLTI